MSEQPSLLALPKDWPWVLLLAAFFGGLAGLTNGLRVNQPRFPSKQNGVDFLLGALAGIFGVGLIRPGDALGIATTAGLAGWLKDTFISQRANQLVTEKANAVDELINELGDLPAEDELEPEGNGSPAAGEQLRGQAVDEAAASLPKALELLEQLDPDTRRQAFDRLMATLSPEEQEMAITLKNLLLNDQEGGK